MTDLKEKLLSLELHEDIEISGYLNVIRVPGGWIYRFFDEKDTADERPTFQSAVFVPIVNSSSF